MFNVFISVKFWVHCVCACLNLYMYVYVSMAKFYSEYICFDFYENHSQKQISLNKITLFFLIFPWSNKCLVWLTRILRSILLISQENKRRMMKIPIPFKFSWRSSEYPRPPWLGRSCVTQKSTLRVVSHTWMTSGLAIFLPRWARYLNSLSLNFYKVGIVNS
jgi:hypothetical protein